MKYFAYGSNMSFKQMETRCPSSIFLGIAKLPKWKFRYDGYSKKWDAAVGNVIKTERQSDFVLGGLFEIN